MLDCLGGMGTSLLHFFEPLIKFGRAMWNALADDPTGLLWAVGATLLITGVALIIGLVIGSLAAVVRVVPKRSRGIRLLDKIVGGYITVIRGTPVIVQLLVFYFGIFIRLQINPLFVACGVFGINSSAYVAEIVRGGLLGVDRGQMEAGRSLGLSYATTMRRIVIPQAIKTVLPALGNEFIVLLKETSVASVIGAKDMTRVFQLYGSKTYDVFAPYVMLAILYLILVLGATKLINLLERRLRTSDHH